MDPVISGGLIGIAIGVAIICMVFVIVEYKQHQRLKREKEAFLKKHHHMKRESHRANVKRNK